MALIVGTVAAVLPAGLAESVPWRPLDQSPVPDVVRSSPVGSYNRPPEVEAGPLLTVAVDTAVELAGVARDDLVGLPPGRLDVQWELVSGPSAPVIADETDPTTEVTFTAVGQYVFTLHAFDGLAPSMDHVVVNVLQPADVDRMLRIMALGDSITHGYLPGLDTFRAPLWHHLAAAGCVFDLVGHQNGTAHGPLADTEVDPHHEGHNGRPVNELRADLRRWAASQVPNVVLVHAGTNDAALERPASAVRSDLDEMIDILRAVDPEVKVFLAEIIPARWDTTGRIDAINAAVREVAAARSTAGSPVVAVDMHSGFDVDAHTADGTHPNVAGEELIAQRWWAALRPHVAASCDGI